MGLLAIAQANALNSEPVVQHAIPEIEGAVPVEQPQVFSAEDAVTGFTTAFLEEKGVAEMLKTFQITEVPAYYIKPEHFRQASAPTLEESLADIPVVDLESSHEDLVTAITKACQWGFLQVVNHGTSLNLLRKIARQSEEFFELPVEEKTRCRTEAKVAGPIHFGAGSKGDWRDVLKINCAPTSAVSTEHWPLQPVGFRETLMDYVTQQQRLVRKLLEIISESLGLEKGYIIAECKDPRVVLAINHYPPCPDPTLTMGIREHSDPCTITVLLQDEVAGLQVFKDGLWVDVKPIKDALVVNVGDHLQMLTNGKYPSCLHRVLNNKSTSRTSIALFLSPCLDANVKPARALVDEEHPALYREVIYGDFLKDFYRSGGPNKKLALSFQKRNETV